MLHKNAARFETANSTPSSSPHTLRLMPYVPPKHKVSYAPLLVAFLMIVSRRCSAFFAETAVLVLVFGILDYCLLKGRIELTWIAAALGISLGLLAVSITMDFAAHRWVKAHP